MKSILFILSGLPASGKSTIAKLIVREYKAVYLRIDTIEQGLRDLCNFKVQGEGYRLSYRIANDNLALGQNIVSDSCNPIDLTRKEWEEVAQMNNSIFINIEILCSNKEEHRKRIETRQTEIKGLKLPVWQEVETREYHSWKNERIIIDTANKSIEKSFEELKKKIQQYLKIKSYEPMNINKNEILRNICYTELVYKRINKKLNTKFSKRQIEKLIFEVINETDDNCFEKMGKNYYITNTENNIRITINSNNFRVITVDRIINKQEF